MKKIFILLLVLMVLCLTSCSLGERMLGGFFKSVNSSGNPLSGDDSGLANARFEHILNACANRDEGAMKALFSQRAIEEAVDIDKSII